MLTKKSVTENARKRLKRLFPPRKTDHVIHTSIKPTPQPKDYLYEYTNLYYPFHKEPLLNLENILHYTTAQSWPEQVSDGTDESESNE